MRICDPPVSLTPLRVATMALFPPKNPAPAPAPIPMPAAARPTTLSAEDIARARNIGSQIRGRFAQTLVGQDNLRESLITTLVAGGHILIESVPGPGQNHCRADPGHLGVRHVQTRPMHARPHAFDTWSARRSSTSPRRNSPRRSARSTPTSCCSTKSTVPTPKPSPPCLKPWRRARPPSEANASRCRNHSWSSQRRIQSRKRAPSIFPRRRWTVS